MHVLPLPSYVGRAGGEKVSTFDSRRLYVALPRHVGVQQERKEHMRQEAGGSPFKSVLLSVGAD